MLKCVLWLLQMGGLEGLMECWQDCAWEPYTYKGRGWKIQQAWEQLSCCRLCLFPFCSGLFWWHWPVLFGFSGTSTAWCYLWTCWLSPSFPFWLLPVSRAVFSEGVNANICCFGKCSCYASYWCFVTTFPYLPSSLLLCFVLPRPCWSSSTTPSTPFFLSLLSTLLCLLSFLSSLAFLPSLLIWTVPPRPSFLSVFH